MIQVIILSVLLVGALYMLGKTIKEMFLLIGFKNNKKKEDKDGWFKFNKRPNALTYKYELLVMISDYYLSLHWHPTKHKLMEGRVKRYIQFSCVNMRKTISEIFNEDELKDFDENFDDHMYNWQQGEAKGHYLDHYDPSHKI